MTKLQQVKEFIKCKESFEHYCENHVLIEIPGGDILLKPYDKQKELIEKLLIERYLLVLKSRQVGISTIIQALCSWLVVFFDNVVVGIISKDGKEATDFARAVRGMVEKLPSWMNPGFDKYTEQSFILKNGSKVFAATVNPQAPEKTLRGKPITFLVIDEAAFIKNIDEAWTSMVPALSTSQKHARNSGIPYGTIILSTPNKTMGTGAWYYKKYTQAISDDYDSIFKPFIIHWKMIPELANDPEWYNTQCRLFDNDPKKIEQELELKFLPSGGSFFDDKVCIILQEDKREPRKKVKLFNSEFWEFEEPNNDSYYLIGVDTAPEFGSDESAINVIDYETAEQVAEYKGKISVTNFCKIIEYVAHRFHGLLIIEKNSYGNQVVEYFDNKTENNIPIYKEKKSEGKVSSGLTTNLKTRPLMINALYKYITQYTNSIKSSRTAMQLIGLVEKKNGKVEADTGCKDDLVLSISLCYYVREYDPPLILEKKDSIVMKNFNDIIVLNNDESIENEFKNMNNINSDLLKQIKDKNLNSSYVDMITFIRS